jgi:hypothetical protein
MGYRRGYKTAQFAKLRKAGENTCVAAIEHWVAIVPVFENVGIELTFQQSMFFINPF